MSDAPSAQSSSAIRRALERCTGGRRCACPDHSYATPSASVSAPSNAATDGGAGGRSISHESSSHHSVSSGFTDSSNPPARSEDQWSGLSSVRVPKCFHGRHCVLKKAWGGKHSGRRFLGCPIKDKEEQCEYREWLDDPWPERVQSSLKTVFHELSVSKHIERQTHDTLMEALQQNERFHREKTEMQADVSRTKRVAERVCGGYHRRAVSAIIDKIKMQYLVHCLLAVVVIQMVVILFKK